MRAASHTGNESGYFQHLIAGDLFVECKTPVHSYAGNFSIHNFTSQSTFSDLVSANVQAVQAHPKRGNNDAELDLSAHLVGLHCVSHGGGVDVGGSN
jgi:hypothetical protein